MGSLTKIAQANQAEQELSGADYIKVACAHLTNYLADAAANGRQVKTASLKGEVNVERLQKCASLYVIDEFDLYKEAGIDKKKVMEALQGFFERVKHPTAYNTINPATKRFGKAGLLRPVMKFGKGVGEGAADLAGKKGVQIGAGALGGLGAGYGINELLRDQGIVGEG